MSKPDKPKIKNQKYVDGQNVKEDTRNPLRLEAGDNKAIHHGR